MNNLILYTTEDGKSQIKLRADLGTVWLTQLEMGELFDATKQNVSLHLKNLFADGELDPVATVKESLTVQTEGSRQVQRTVTLYNLDAILAVGYRVRSSRGTQFRRWATERLSEYLRKGFTLDDDGTLAEIHRLWTTAGYLADPHTAVGTAAAPQRFCTSCAAASTSSSARFIWVRVRPASSCSI